MVRRNICILVNPYAGNAWARRVLIKLEEALNTLPVSYRIIVTTDKFHAQQLAIEATSQGEYVAVMGGDGSVRVVAEALMKHGGVLAVLPAGRGNDFARMLNYPLNPISACKILAYGREATIDMGQVNDKPFLTICSLGFDSVVNRIANSSLFINGRAVYLYAGLRALPSWKPLRFKVTVDGCEFEHVGYTIAVANTQYYGGGMRLVPGASLQDGLLDMALIGDISKLSVIRNIPRIFKGTHVDQDGFKVIRGRHFYIETDPQYLLYADGDSIYPPPASISVIPNALRVLMPN